MTAIWTIKCLLLLRSSLFSASDLAAVENQLRSQAPGLRVAAIRRLAKFPADTRISEPLFDTLNDPSPEVRAESARTWSIVGSRLNRAIEAQKGVPNSQEGEHSTERWQAWQRRLVDALTRASSDPDDRVTYDALRTLAALGYSVENTVPPEGGRCGTGEELRLDFKADEAFGLVAKGRDRIITQFLDDSDAEVVYHGISTLEKTHPGEVKPYLVRFLGDARWQLRGLSALYLARIDKERATELIVPLLADPYSRVRTTAIMCLKNPGRVLAILAPSFAYDSIALKRSILDLIDGLKAASYAEVARLGAVDTNATVRAEALAAADHSHTLLPEVVLVSNCQHSDPRVRSVAARTYMHQSGNEAGEMLVRLLMDRDESVRRDALWLLCDLKNAVLLGPMLAAYRRSDDEYDPGIGQTIRDAGLALAPLVRKLLKDRDSRFRILGLQCSVAALGERAAPVAAERALKDMDDKVRRCALEILGDSGDSRHLSVLQPLLSDSDREIRFYTIWAVGNLPHPNAVSLITPFLEDSDERTARMAKDAIERQRSGEAGIRRGQFAPEEPAVERP